MCLDKDGQLECKHFAVSLLLFVSVLESLYFQSHISSLKWAWALPGTIMWFANGLQQERLADDVEENWLTGEDHVLEKGNLL